MINEWIREESEKRRGSQDVVSCKPSVCRIDSHKGATHNVQVMSEATTNMHGLLSYDNSLFSTLQRYVIIQYIVQKSQFILIFLHFFYVLTSFLPKMTEK